MQGSIVCMCRCNELIKLKKKKKKKKKREITRNKIYSIPIQPDYVFKSQVIRSQDLVMYGYGLLV